VLVVRKRKPRSAKAFQHGLTAQNRLVLEKFIQYAHEQDTFPAVRHCPKCSPPLGSNDACLRRLQRDYFSRYFELHPTEAIHYGVPGYDHRLKDFTDEAYREEKA
jgi:hypothetical protein